MQADGTNARIVADSLNLEGSPAWSPGGKSIATAADDHGIPHLFRVPVGAVPRLSWFKSIRSILRGRLTAASLSTRGPTSARLFR
jgi:hypothetical protein